MSQQTPNSSAVPRDVSRRRSHRPSIVLPPELTAAVLRERIYGDIACLSSLLVLTQHIEASTPWSAVIDVLIATVGLWGASLFAEFVAHLSLHGSAPRGRELTGIFRTSGQILEAAGLPTAILIASALGWFRFHAALWTSVWLLIATLGLFALLAARRTTLSWWGRSLLVLALMGLGGLIVLVKILSH